MSYQKIILHAFKLTLFVTLFTFFSTFSYSLPTNLQQQIEVSGYYYLETKAAKTFPEIAWIDLSTRDSKGNEIPLNGSIRIKKRPITNYNFASVSLKNNIFTFTTKTIKNIHYEFSGTFLTDSPTEASPDDIVLKGILKKFQGEKVIAQEDVIFTYFGGD